MATAVHPIIAREAWPVLLLGCAGAAAVNWLFGTMAASPLWLACAGLVYLFRDPPRQISTAPLAVVCPVHGRVLHIGPIVDEWTQRSSVRIVLKMVLLDIYSLRSPIEGRIMEQWVNSADGGRRRSAYWIRTDEEDDVIFSITPRNFASRVICTAHPGDRVGQGQRIGLCLFGARVEIYLPENSQIEIKPGDRVLAGTSVAGRLVHEPAEYAEGTEPSAAAE